jgi:hypothetical protein
MCFPLSLLQKGVSRCVVAPHGPRHALQCLACPSSSKSSCDARLINEHEFKTVFIKETILETVPELGIENMFNMLNLQTENELVP